MSKRQLIEQGEKIGKISDILELREKYEVWKDAVLRYASQDEMVLERCRVQLHVMENPFESEQEKRDKYLSCIKRVLNIIQEETGVRNVWKENAVLETVISNFDLYLQNMFRVVPENKATLKKEILNQIVINNEYDVQHIMYAVIKALYPSARREVNQDTGYGTVRYDIVIEEIDTVIEIKCTRKDHTENKLYRELGEDGFFYKCSKLIIYIYDKQNVIHDVNNFVKTLERTKETAGKEVKVYVDQVKKLV